MSENIRLNFFDFLGIFKENLNNAWLSRYQEWSSDKETIYSQYSNKPSDKPWFLYLQKRLRNLITTLSRLEEVIIARFRNEHLFKPKINVLPNCDCDETDKMSLSGVVMGSGHTKY